MSGEWSCNVCTFRHAFHGTRCSMCNSLRVTKQQMRDFVAGGGVNKDSNQMGKHNHLASSSIRKDYTTMDISKGCENSVGQSIDADQRGESSRNEPLQGPSLSIVNPYRKPNKVTAVRNHVGTLNAKTLKDRENDRYQVKNTEQREMMKLPSDESNQLTRIPPQTRDAPSSNTTSSKRILNPYAKVHSSVSSDRSRTPITASNPLHSTSSNIDDSSRKIGNPKTILDARTNDKQYEHEVNCVSDQVASRNSPKKSRHPGSQSNASQLVIHDANGLLLDQVASRHSLKKRRHPESQSNATQQTTLGFLLERDGTHMTPAEHNCVLQGYSPGPVPLADGDVCKTWIYPMSDNYAERKYQLEITRSAILHNTLVSLPTGLGKTLIAAVVMYNFYRWFPKGKVLFLAPTRPLVRQQIEACYNIMGIPEIDTAEISGTIKDRENLWRTRRVFFCTPQACQRDIEYGLCDAKMIVCLVLDEAHKTTKKYAYNIVLQHLRDAGAKARIVGLSATPGRDLKGIQEVVENLGVSKIEARVDTDPEVKPYVHDRSYEVIKVEPCTAEVTVANLLNKVLNPLVDMLRERNGLRLFRGPNSSLTSYNILLEQQQRKQQNDFSLVQQHSVVQALLSAREALNQNGILMARNKLSVFMEKFSGKGGFASRVLQSETFLNLWATVVKLQDTGKSFSQDDIDDLKLHNPKLEKLEFILKEHFERARVCNESSRAIVFSQLRDSVEEIVGVLTGLAPLVLATKFVGQGSGTLIEDTSTPNTKRTRSTKVSGMNQKEQQRVIKEFRDGKFNVLVCTCIGEEGLDIGQVDLIVNFDCLRSPIRMIQRTGRTGRKRDGRVVCLVSKGKEEQRLQKSEADTRQLWNALKNPRAFTLAKQTPLLPVHPMLTRENMNVARSYRLSQIGGHGQRSVRRKNIEAMDLGNWKLTIEQEIARVENYGRCRFSHSIVKECIKTWQNCSPIRRQELANAFGFGQSCSVLRKVELSIIADGKENNLYRSNRSPFVQTKTSHNSSLKVIHPECRVSTIESHISSQNSDIGSSTEYICDNEVLMHDEKSPGKYQCNHSLENSTDAKANTNIFPVLDPSISGSYCQLDDPTWYHGESLDVASGPSSRTVERRFSAREINIIWGETDENCCVEAPQNTEECRWFMLKDDHGMDEILYPSVPKDNLLCSPKSAVSKSPLQSEDDNVLLSHIPSSDLNVRNFDGTEESGGVIQSDRSAQRKESEVVKDKQQLLVEAHNSCSFESEKESYVIDEVDEDASRIVKSFSLDNVESTPSRLKRKRSTDEEFSVYFDLATPESSSSSDESETDDTVHVKSASIAQIIGMNKDATVDLTENRNVEEKSHSQGSNHVPVLPSQNEEILTNEVEKPLSLAEALRENPQINASRMKLNDTVHQLNGSKCQKQKLEDGTPVFDMEDEGKVNFSNIPNSSQDETPILNKSKSRKKILDPFLSQFSPSLPSSSNRKNVFKNTGGLYDTPASKTQDERGVESLDDTPQETSSLSSKHINLSICSEERQRSKKEKVEKLVKQRKRRNVACKYLDIEAEVDGDDSEDDDEDEYGLSNDSFINDSSQLGYTQDNLDAIDHYVDLSQTSVNAGSVTIHRQVDMMKELENAFATPTLRRNNSRNTQLSLPSSEKHLGQMHFIRSVIEHHRQGGDADELERGYHDLLKSTGIPYTQDSTRLVDPAIPSSSISTSKSEVSKKITLTAEQLERIERNKQKALMIRRQRMNQM